MSAEQATPSEYSDLNEVIFEDAAEHSAAAVEVSDLAASDAEATEQDVPKRAILGLLKSPIGIAGVAISLALIGGAAFFLSSSFLKSEPPHEAEIADDSTDYKKEASEVGEASAAAPDASATDPVAGEDTERRFENEYGSLTFSGAEAMYHTASTTVALEQGPNARTVRLSVGILTDREAAEQLFAEGLEVSLLKIEAVESVDIGPYREWEIPGLIVTAFREKLSEAYPETNIRAVIIRDFNRV